jgi:hypothetical protein
MSIPWLSCDEDDLLAAYRVTKYLCGWERMAAEDAKEFLSWLLQRENPSLSLRDAKELAATFICSARKVEVVAEDSGGQKRVYRGRDPFVPPRFLGCG